MRRAVPLLAALVLTHGACDAPCAPGTLLLELSVAPAGALRSLADADELRIRIGGNRSSPVSAPGAFADGMLVAVELGAGYRAGAAVDVYVTAFQRGEPAAAGGGQLTLAPTCTTGAVTLGTALAQAAGAPARLRTTVEIRAPSPLIANGVSEAEVVIRVRDADGLPAADRSVTVEALGEDARVLQPAPTDAAGEAVARVTATAAGTKLVVVRDAAGDELGSGAITFEAAPAIASDVRITGNGSCFLVEYTLVQLGAQPVSAAIEFSDGVTSNDETYRPVSDRSGQLATQLATLPAAKPRGRVRHSFVWDSNRDVPGRHTVRLRVTPTIASPSGPIAGVAAKSPPFEVINEPRFHIDRVPDSATALAVADLDLDGVIDAIVASPAIETLSTLRGSGDGRFERERRMPGDASVKALGAGDVDGDGVPDLVSAGAQGVGLRRGRGDGTFGPRSTIGDVGIDAIGVGILDLDGDGDMDLAIAHAAAPPETSRALLLENDGVGGFTLRAGLELPDRPRALVTGDFDGDGLPDLAVGLEGSGVTIIRSDGLPLGPGATLGEVTTTGRVVALVVADLSPLDGNADLVVSTGGGLIAHSVDVLPGDGKGGFGPAEELFKPLVDRPVPFLAAASLDGRSTLAAVVPAASSLHTAVARATAASPPAVANQLAPSSTQGLGIADLNQDGVVDLVVTSGVGALTTWLGGLDGSFRPPDSLLAPSQPVQQYVLAGYFANDQHVGLALRSAGPPPTTLALMQRTDAGWSAAKPLPLAGDSLPFAVCRFGARPGLAALLGDNSWLVYALDHDGDGGLAVRASFDLGEQISSLACADLDRDGVDEVFYSPAWNAGAYMLALDGTGQAFVRSTVDAMAGTGRVVPGDYDGDAWRDLAIITNEQVVRVLRGSPAGLSPPTTYEIPSIGADATARDVNGDGADDLVLLQPNGVGLLLSRPDGTLAPIATHSTGAEPSPAGLGVEDVNGDERVDIVVGGARGIVVLLGHGDGTFEAPSSYPAPTTGIGQLAIADLDGRGWLDVVQGNARGDLNFFYNDTPPACVPLPPVRGPGRRQPPPWSPQ